MSRPREPWWGYVKNMIRRYPQHRARLEELHSTRITPNLSGMPRGGQSNQVQDAACRELPKNSQREYDAVRRAIVDTATKRTGSLRLQMVDLVFWKRTHTLAGAAMKLNCGERTICRWHAEFIYTVAKKYGFYD